CWRYQSRRVHMQPVERMALSYRIIALSCSSRPAGDTSHAVCTCSLSSAWRSPTELLRFLVAADLLAIPVTPCAHAACRAHGALLQTYSAFLSQPTCWRYQSRRVHMQPVERMALSYRIIALSCSSRPAGDTSHAVCTCSLSSAWRSPTE